MQFTTLEDLFTHPSFIALLATIIVVIGNIIVGVSIRPNDKRRRGYDLHRYIFWGGVAVYILFLVANHFYLSNSIFTYLVLVYFVTVIPLSKKMNVTLHAILSSVGLVLLILVGALHVL